MVSKFKTISWLPKLRNVRFSLNLINWHKKVCQIAYLIFPYSNLFPPWQNELWMWNLKVSPSVDPFNSIFLLYPSASSCLSQDWEFRAHWSWEKKQKNLLSGKSTIQCKPHALKEHGNGHRDNVYGSFGGKKGWHKYVIDHKQQLFPLHLLNFLLLRIQSSNLGYFWSFKYSKLTIVIKGN